jgi:hypothetical protein
MLGRRVIGPNEPANQQTSVLYWRLSDFKAQRKPQILVKVHSKLMLGKHRFLDSTVDGKGSLSNNFSVIFPSFVHLLATKRMAKQSRASGQLSGGHWVE